MVMEIDIRNIAGIRRGTARIRPGVNAVRGLNWQGKTSFVRAVEAAMGTATPLTEGASEGRVELDAGGSVTVVELAREGDTVVRNGEPYLDDEYDRICADLYAFLDGENEVRAAVRRGENLEDVLTRPLAFEDIDARLADLEAEQRRVESELERAREAARDLPDVQETVTRLERELEDLRADRADLLEDREGRAAGGDLREELSDARAERSRLEDRVDRLEDATGRIEAELEAKRAELADIEVPDVDVDEDVDTLRDELDAVERDVELVQGLYSANKRIVEENRLGLVTDVDRGLVDDEVDCWVCGSEVELADVEARVGRLGDTLAALEDEAESCRDRIEAIEEKREAAERARRERRDLEREVTDLEHSLEDRRESLESATDRLDEVTARIDDLAEQVAEGEDELTDLQSDIKYTENRLADARDRLEELSRRADRTDSLEATLEDIRGQQEQLRSRKSRIKRETRDAFDETVEDLVRRVETSFEAARLTGNFDLVVARDGREVSLDALSEGERELIGIVAALAGYEAYDVGDRVPVLALDAIGGLAEQNLKTLVEYLEDRPDYLVFTSYPEHTSFEGNELDPDEWDVVSDETEFEPDRSGPEPGPG